MKEKHCLMMAPVTRYVHNVLIFTIKTAFLMEETADLANLLQAQAYLLVTTSSISKLRTEIMVLTTVTGTTQCIQTQDMTMKISILALQCVTKVLTNGPETM